MECVWSRASTGLGFGDDLGGLVLGLLNVDCFICYVSYWEALVYYLLAILFQHGVGVLLVVMYVRSILAK